MLFKILHGDESNILLDVTPFHEGWCYVTHSGYFYVDLNVGTTESPNNQRLKLNASNAETLTGLTLEEIQKSISWNDLLDRPFGYETEVETPLTVERTFTDWCLLTNATDSWSTLSQAHSDGCIVKVYYDDEVYLCAAETGGSGFILVSDTELPFTATEAVAGSDGSIKFTALDGGTHTVLLTRVDAEVVKVPEEYIPDTIARVSDIPDGGVQADMAQNDSAEPDYIKNRTHWKEELGVQALFDGTIETDYGWNTDQGVPAAIEIKIGTTYSVVYDGATYEVVGKVGADNIPYIGSDSLWNNDSYVETEEPFCYGDGWFGASVDGIHTVVISGEATEWHAIEKEYLPGVLIRPGDGYKSEVFNDTTNTASGTMSHAEGSYTSATGDYSHVEGCNNTASGTYSHAEGYNTEASGWHAHTEGYSTVASGNHSHAEGRDAVASGFTSHAEGRGTTAAGEYQHVQGKYNIVDESSIYAHIVGNGGVRGMESRSNAHTIDWFGNAWFRGDLRVGGTNYDDAISLLPRVTTVDLLVANWTGGSNNLYSQVVTVNTATANTLIEINPSATQILSMQNDEVVLTVENVNGVVTFYAINKPTVDFTNLQLRLEEVSYV